MTDKREVARNEAREAGQALDAALIEQALDGDLEAFNRLVVRHQDHLYALVYRLVPDRDQAADAVQEAFFSAYRKLATFRGGSVRSWLGRIAVNAAMDLQRARKRRPAQPYPELEDETWQPAGDEKAEPEQLSLAGERTRIIAAALARLPEEQRNCIVLFDVEGYDYGEIAGLMGISVGTVKSRIHRGRVSLRTALEPARELLRGRDRLRIVMKRNPAAHAAHDELILARLYGGDLDGREFERARQMAATCAGCAAAIADFAAFAAATANLPVPPRPRDFTIGAAQARELRRGRGRAHPMGLRAILGRLGPVRSLGASMAAAGVAGIFALGALSVVGPAGTGTTSVRQADGPVAAEGGAGASQQPLDGPGASQNWASAPTAGTAPVTTGSAPQKDASATNRNDLAAASTVPDGQFGAQGEGTNGGQAPTSPESGAPWPLLFGGLAAGGLILLAAPAAGRRYSSRRR